jgi:hypothetical protein
MSHWAQLDESNKVIQVVVGNNDESDEGYQWLIDRLGGTWIQTSYNGKIRYNFAGIGFTYDPIDDAFIAPAPCSHSELFLNDKKKWECSNLSHTIVRND